MSLFDAPLAEDTTAEGQRYILRRNPEPAKEIASSRESKYGALNTAMVAANEYLATHPRADPGTQLKNLSDQSRSHEWRTQGTGCGYSAGVTGQGFSSKINDELTLFGCNSGP